MASSKASLSFQDTSTLPFSLLLRLGDHPDIIRIYDKATELLKGKKLTYPEEVQAALKGLNSLSGFIDETRLKVIVQLIIESLGCCSDFPFHPEEDRIEERKEEDPERWIREVYNPQVLSSSSRLDPATVRKSS